MLYEEIFRKRINSLDGISHRRDNDERILIDKIKYDISDAYAKGKISESHYGLLDKLVESRTNNPH